eukprot:gene8474-4835_t
MVSLGALKPGDHVVVGQMVGDDFCLKAITADKAWWSRDTNVALVCEIQTGQGGSKSGLP